MVRIGHKGDGCIKKKTFAPSENLRWSSVEACCLSGDYVSRSVILPGGGIMAGWLTDCSTLWTGSQRGRVTEPVGTGFTPPPPWTADRCTWSAEIGLLCCAVYEKDRDRDQELLTCQVLAGHAEDTRGDRWGVRGQRVGRDGIPSLPFSYQELRDRSICFHFYLGNPLSYYINALYKQLKMGESDRKTSMFILYVALKMHVFQSPVYVLYFYSSNLSLSFYDLYFMCK